jgi:hypothetical protein
MSYTVICPGCHGFGNCRECGGRAQTAQLRRDRDGAWREIPTNCRGRDCQGGLCRVCSGRGRLNEADADRRYGAGNYAGARRGSDPVSRGVSSYQRGQQLGRDLPPVAGCLLPMLLAPALLPSRLMLRLARARHAGS